MSTRASVTTAMASLVVAGAIGVALVAGASHVRLTLTLCGLALVLLALGVALGSWRTVGIAGVPLLGAALLEVTVADDPPTVLAAVVGCAWYVAVELAWESIERRDPCIRTPELTRRRVQEVASVVALALVVAVTGLAATSVAPVRTVLVQAVVIAAVLVGIAAAARRLAATAPADR